MFVLPPANLCSLFDCSLAAGQLLHVMGMGQARAEFARPIPQSHHSDRLSGDRKFSSLISQL